MSDATNWVRDSYLDPSIRFPNSLSEFAEDPRRILLTGATGFLGSYLLAELLNHSCSTVLCVTRQKGEGSPRRRLEDRLRHFGIWKDTYSDRIEVVEGNLEAPRLGLTADEWLRIAKDVDAIFHCGAAVNNFFPYQRLRSANVLATIELLKLAGHVSTKPFHFVSSVAVYLGSSARAGKPVLESDPCLNHAGLRGGYKRSKWVADQLVREAGRRELPITIHRPGRITAEQSSGIVGNLNDMFYVLLRACILLGAYPRLEGGIGGLPVDNVAEAICRLSKCQENWGSSFHLVSDEPLSWPRFFSLVSSCGYSMKALSRDEWFAEWTERGAELVGEPLNSLVRLLLLAPNDLERADAGFDCRATRESLSRLGITLRNMDGDLLGVYLSYLAQAGIIPKAIGSQSSKLGLSNGLI